MPSDRIEGQPTSNSVRNAACAAIFTALVEAPWAISGHDRASTCVSDAPGSSISCTTSGDGLGGPRQADQRQARPGRRGRRRGFQIWVTI